ncbi:MAG: BatD family protein [Planctomycetota bacterium]|nr:BatD family protein [Planctomycetota bacterium]
MRSTIALCSVLCVSAMVLAQEQLRVQGPVPATVVLGSSSRVDLVVEGADSDPESPNVPAVKGLSCRIIGPSRQMFRSFGGGRNTNQVTTSYTLQLQPQQEGKFTIPAFAWRTGSKAQQVGPFVLDAVKELRGSEFGYLDVQLERQRLYVHEPLRVRVAFGVDKGLRLVEGAANNGQRYYDIEVQAPFLSAMVGAESIPLGDEPGQRAPTVLNQTLQFVSYEADQMRGAKAFQSFTFHKAFLPTRPGKFTLDAPMLRYNVQMREGRSGLFGERLGGQQQNYYVYGKPLEIEVLSIPELGRPSPYFGAVGRFTIEASADRDRVKVGNSVKVTFVIRGSGNTEFLRVPDLEAFEELGLHKLAQSKAQQGDALIVTYDLMPIVATLREIPAIEWNFFDTTPSVEQFVSLATKSLPLTVQPLAEGETLVPLRDEVKKAVVKGVDDIFDLPELLGAPIVKPDSAPWLAWFACLVPWCLVAGFLSLRSFVTRRSGDPLAVRARHAARVCEQALDAGGDPLAVFAEYLAARLRVSAAAVIGQDLSQRLRAAGFKDEIVAAAVAAIEHGTEARYGFGGGLDVAAVRALVARFQAASGGLKAAKSSLVLLAVLLACSGTLQAQEADAAVAAYRAGDYDLAEHLFAADFARNSDRRLWSARGNCYYRKSDFARAIWAYECARLGLSRDQELLANLRLALKQLELGGEASQPFVAALAELRDRLSAKELALLAALAMTIAALGIGIFWRRPAVRWLGIVALLPGLLIATELLFLSPSRPAMAIALSRLDLSSEPRLGLVTVATVAKGTKVLLRSDVSGEWVRVSVEGHSGYAQRSLVGKIE